jgi:uncharacterized membrane protein YphA (DoxX/SURF4 family)
LLEVLAAVGRGSGASDPTKVIEMMGRIAVVLILIVSGVQKLAKGVALDIPSPRGWVERRKSAAVSC